MSSSSMETPTAKPLNVAAILFVLCALWIAPAAWCGYKLLKSRAAETAEPAEGEKAVKDLKLASADENRPSYVVVLVLAAVGAIGSLVGGFWSSASRATTPPEKHSRSGAILLAIIGGITGLLLMALAVWFLIDEYKMLADWLTKKETKTKDLWRILVPALLFIAGTGAAFLAAQPARKQERHDQTARRLVYGTNLAVTGILLFAALVLLNGFVALRLPNRLDTTAAGYYTIAPSTEDYVRNLSEKVTVYTFGGAGQDETAVLLQACQDLNPSKFIPRSVGRGVGPQELQKLRAKFPSVDFNNVAMIVAVGEDEARYSSIRESEVVREEQPRSPEEPPQRFYEGETRLVRELLFLSDGKNKATVYFTQGNGELALAATGGKQTSPDRSAAELKAYLEKANLQVMPLPFDSKAPKIPDDASVIVIADPTLTLSKELAEALMKFMNEPRADGKKGKLIVLSAPHATPKGDTVQPTGLEELLKAFNVELAPAFLFNPPDDQSAAEQILGIASIQLQLSGHPVAGALPPARLRRPWLLTNSRAIEILPNANPANQTSALIETYGEGLITWQETEQQDDTGATFKRLQAQYKANPQATALKKKMTAEPVPLAAVATEGATPRLVVVGNGQLFNDATAANRKDGVGFRLVAASIDWLRDRPVVDVANKQYGFYTPQDKMDRMRLLFLPFGLVVLGIVGLSAGIWVIRRK